METRHDFRLNFTTNRNEIMTLNIPHADTTADGADVAAAMEGIIDSSIVQSARGEPLFRYAADLVTTNRTDFNIFA